MANNITSAQVEQVRWAELDVVDPQGRENKKEPNPDQKDQGLIAGVSVARNNYNFMFDKYHELFDQLRIYIDQLTLDANSTILDDIYPVGSHYFTSLDADPATEIFGSIGTPFGTWQKIEDTFLMAAGTTYPAGTSGGSANHTHTDDYTVDGHVLTVDELPSHTHDVTGLEDPRGSASADGSENGNSSFDVTKTTTATGGDQAHSHGLSGGIQAASNIPPYLAIYVWVRVA